MTAPGYVAVVGDDGVGRCPWGAGSELLGEYHDREWGRVLHGRDALYERISLEAFQSGLSWLIVLRKRPAFREAFAGFDPEAVARFDETDTARLLADAGIVRNRAKIEATVANARAVLALADRDEDLDTLLWSFAPTPAGAAAERARRRPRDHPRVDRDGEGAAGPRLPVRGSDDLLRAHAGDRDGRRPRGRMLPRDRRTGGLTGRVTGADTPG